ncbi:Cytochrome P450 [Botryosphaeria dothidea]|uniref:Cytochrome P450 n=1 Tax=Botryosphaeria dothidea TaxID=55169 RepID=A0A8H4N1F7_9PEZI|nr:Cytochrome P450 [Botryosphaeria dothidea]
MDRIPAVSGTTKGVIALALLAGIIAIFQRIFNAPQDPREPPLVPSRVPLIGHAIGMYRHGKRYFQMIDQKYGYDIYTLPLPGVKMYIVTGPEMTAAINRQGKSVGFRPFVVDFTRNSMQFDDEHHAINVKNIYDEEGGKGLLTDNHDLLYRTLPNGPVLDELCHTILDGAAENINAIDRKEATMGLMQFSLNLMGLLSARAFWGPQNVMDKDPTLLTSFWHMENAQSILGLGVFPSILARKGYVGRARLAAAMEHYFEQGHWKTASTLVRERAEVHWAHGYKPKMMGHADMGLLIGTTPNTTRTLFWFLAYLFAETSLAADVRAELAESGAVARSADGSAAVVDVQALRSSCPLYASALREVLRLRMPTSSVRKVREDVVLGDRYLLRKGAMCLIDAGVMHKKPSIWGADAADFNPRRFMKYQGGEFMDGSGRKVHPAALRVWGGGEVVCPGRFLATIEMVAIAAPLIMGWDVEGEDGGKVKVPKPRDDIIPVGMYDPSEDVRVKLIGREEWKNVAWEYKI